MQFCHDWLHFFPTTLPYTGEEKKHLDVAGIPDELALKADFLSIITWSLG